MKLKNDYVISGLSGRYPEASDLDEFWQKLLRGEPLYSSDDRRWPVDLLGLPTHSGKIENITKFDRKFFGFNEYDAHSMDPQSRKLLEVVFETIVDAGLDPQDLRGTKTCLILGSCYDDTRIGQTEDEFKLRNFLQLNAERVSSFYNLKGPIATVDTACASSFTCFHEALIYLESGLCNRAIVCGTAIHLRPLVTRAFLNMNMLSKDGISKCLDRDVDGYCRSEAVVALIIERAPDAKRMYAKVINSCTNCDGYKVEGITYPRAETQQQLMEYTLAEAGINPLDLDYIEAHVTGTMAGDPIECGAILRAYRPGIVKLDDGCKPLRMGCLKSNMGHTEGASGVCSITKACKIFQTGMIPPNLNFHNPNPAIEGLRLGLLDPLQKPSPFDGHLIPLNSFGFGGVNVHVILENNPKTCTSDSYQIYTPIPRLINLSNRTREGILHSQSYLEKNRDKVTRDQLKLIHDVSKIDPQTGFKFRGTMIMTGDEVQSTCKKGVKKIKSKRPLWLTVPPLGCQWPTMGRDLMKIPIFAQSIEKSRTIVASFTDYDVLDIINEDTEIMVDIIKALIGIVSIQIGLIDLLRLLDVEFDGIIGHSIGEVAAAYADGAASQEQALKTAYWLAKSGLNDGKSRGLMAAIGLPWDKAGKRCPQGVEPACNNTSDMVTVAGDYDSVKKMVEELQEENIFAREVSCCDVAYHCSNIERGFDTLIRELSPVYSEPKKISSRWHSTSIPDGSENDPDYTHLTAKYYANMMVGPVKFLQTLRKIPENSAILELGPSSMLNGMIRKERGIRMDYISMMKRDDPGNLLNVLASIGQVYMNGHWPKIDRLYPSVEYPVGRETDTIGNMIRWNHKKDWNVCKYPEYYRQNRVRGTRSIDMMSHRFLLGHVIDGRVLYPATGYLHAFWSYLIFSIGESVSSVDRLPIEFRNVRLHRATILSSTSQINFICFYDAKTGEFRIEDDGTLVASGYCCVPSDTYDYKKYIQDSTKPAEDAVRLEKKEIYKELRCRGYDYGHTFQGLMEAMSDGTYGKLKDDTHWITLADSLMHLYILSISKRALFVPTFIEYLRCDPILLSESKESAKKEFGEPIIDAYFDPLTGIAVTKGLIVKGLKATPTARRTNNASLALEECVFNPYDENIIPEISYIKNSQKYVEFCGKLIDKIGMGSLDEGDANELESWKKHEKESYKILNLMSEIFPTTIKDKGTDDQGKVTTEVQSPAEIMTKFSEKKPFNITEDHSFPVDFQAIRKCVYEITLENVGTRNCIITEINGTDESMIYDMASQFNASGIRCQTSVLRYSQAVCEQTSSDGKKNIRIEEILNTLPDGKACNVIVLTDYRMRIFPFLFESSIEKDGGNFEELPEILKTLSTSNRLRSDGLILLKYRTKMTDIEQKLCSQIKAKETNFSDTKNLLQSMEELGFIEISRKTISDGECIFSLIRKKDVSDDDKVKIFQIKRDDYSWIKPLKEETTKALKQNRIWLVSNGDPYNGLIGMVNCFRREPGGNLIRSVFTPSEQQSNDLVTLEMREKGLATNVLRNGVLGSYRYRKLNNLSEDCIKNCAHIYLDVATKGDLTSLQWYQCPHDTMLPHMPESEAKKVTRVYYSAMNFKDIMVSTGRIGEEAYPFSSTESCAIGMEFSGIQDGRRVMGLAPSGSICTSLFSNYPFFDVPNGWTLEEAATVPVVYTTLYYALFMRGNLRPGESVLIHAGTGGVGQAAINVCLKRGNQVFTTVGTPAKREYIKKKFPALKDDHISCSRDVGFEENILRQTNGRGVDVILNSLAEEKMQASIRCLAPLGRFVEIGKYDLLQDNPIESSLMDQSRSYHACCLAHLTEDALDEHDNIHAKRRLEQVIEMFNQGLRNGEIMPLETTVFEMDQIETAFRFMASGKHLGKVLIKIRDEKTEPQPIDKPLPCIGRTYFHPHKSYIITGGLGGVGLELMYWMAYRGATKFVVTSRNGLKTAYQQYALRRIQKFARFGQVKVIISQYLATSYSSAASLIEQATEMGPVGAIFNLAMVLSDAVFEDQTEETFRAVCEPKANTTINLDKLSRSACPELDYFVCFSSAASGKGNLGQTNYGFANSVMDRVCEIRRQDGLHGISLQWGAIGDVGVVAETLGGNDVVLGGTIPQRINSCMEVLDKFLQTPFSICSSIVMADAKKSGITGGESLCKTICHILGVADIKSIDPSTTLTDLGMDSLMAVEIKQGLERDFDIVLSTQALRNLTIKEIYQLDSQTSANAVSKRDSQSDAKNGNGLNKPFYGLLDMCDDLFIPLNNEEGRMCFFFPPVEGNFASMKPLADRCTLATVGVNWTSEVDKLATLQDVIDYYADNIAKNYPNLSEVNFVGYSFGGFLAWEVACKLQKKLGIQCVRQIVLLESSPYYVKLLMEDVRKYGDFIGEDEAYVELLVHFAAAITELPNVTKIKEEINSIADKEKKKEKLAQFISTQGLAKCDANLITFSATRYFHKIRITLSHQNISKFIGEVTLMKAKDAKCKFSDLNMEKDYGISMINDGRVNVLSFKGDHRSFLMEHIEEIGEEIDRKFHPAIGA
ncbi:fatty acid synthase-like [Brevipalpus obovatus]|uniref:fatty acid synthase-like n=1 Tax=Brevipalpus obovatus TaxID=246614 RepID=UPI003D9E92E2